MSNIDQTKFDTAFSCALNNTCVRPHEADKKRRFSWCLSQTQKDRQGFVELLNRCHKSQSYSGNYSRYWSYEKSWHKLFSDVTCRSGELCPDFIHSLPFTHAERSGRFSAQTHSLYTTNSLHYSGERWSSRQRQEVTEITWLCLQHIHTVVCSYHHKLSLLPCQCVWHITFAFIFFIFASVTLETPSTPHSLWSSVPVCKQSTFWLPVAPAFYNDKIISP